MRDNQEEILETPRLVFASLLRVPDSQIGRIPAQAQSGRWDSGEGDCSFDGQLLSPDRGPPDLCARWLGRQEGKQFTLGGGGSGAPRGADGSTLTFDGKIHVYVRKESDPTRYGYALHGKMMDSGPDALDSLVIAGGSTRARPGSHSNLYHR